MALSIALVIFACLVAGIQTRRWADGRAAERLWRQLAALPTGARQVFDPGMVDELPDAARRYFLFTIEPGAELSGIAEIEMTGSISLGDKDKHKTLRMTARQIIAAPDGLVWRLRAGRGPWRISGSDGVGGGFSWTRFWLFGFLPVVREGGNDDHLKSAFGRVVAESVFFAPAALLPGEGVRWEAVDVNTARAVVEHGGLSQRLLLTVDENGRPEKVVIDRWSDANPEKTYRRQLFGGHVDTFRTFGGYTLPTRIEGGHFIGTDEYFPFYRAEITHLRFI